MIWAIGRSGQLRPETRAAIEDLSNEVVISAVSVWEAAIKINSGKLSMPISLAEALEESRFDRLDMRVEHAFAAGALPLHHKDPFDRMLVAQAQLEGLTLVTTDREFAAYHVAVLPA
jgi:PIN domain nuclease of toxin-antitoxin system